MKVHGELLALELVPETGLLLFFVLLPLNQPKPLLLLLFCSFLFSLALVPVLVLLLLVYHHSLLLYEFQGFLHGCFHVQFYLEFILGILVERSLLS